MIGILWGKFFYFSEENRAALFHKPTLNILAEKDFLLSDVLESYSLENDIEINIITYSSKEDLSKKLTKNIDMVAFKSFNAENIMKDLSPLSYANIKNKDYISVDFKNPPYDPENQFAIPLFWGITKNSNADKQLLWIESLGIVKTSQHKKEAHDFLNYTLQPDIAIEVIRHKQVASTNKSVEKAKNVESKLKPSYLRQMSIRDLSLTDKAGLSF